MSPTPARDLVRRVDVHLRPDPARVVAQLFVAGEELSSGGSRASPLMQRVLAMSDDETERVLAATLRRFEGRHPHLEADLLAHFAQVGDRLGNDGVLSPGRRLLLGAYATSEFAVEAAALCNPSMVAHPDQSGLAPGELRFVLSLRAVGEGHISSIEFRTGRVGPGDSLVVDDPGPLLVDGTLRPTDHDRARFVALVQEAGTADELVALILDGLPPTFTSPQLEASIAALNPQVLTRRRARETIDRIRVIAQSNYGISFAEDSTLGQRVLRPRSPTEARGMEDARFVRFVDDDASVRFYGTYTAFDGSHIEPQMLMTHDFRSFDVHQLRGRSATNKGMALFPRRIDGRYVALSRWDRERNAVTTSVDGWRWDDSVPIQAPEAPWELIQVGNCGSPIETDEGWLVLTHGVGPMRTYSMGALLLDLEHPEQVRGRLASPLLSPEEPEREGYVPNVVYSCGALLHEGTVYLPYAYGDRVTTAATVRLDGLLAALLAP